MDGPLPGGAAHLSWISGEEHLSVVGDRVEVTNGDDVLDLLHQLFLLDAEHLHGQQAGIELDPGVLEDLDELTGPRNVQALHALAHHLGRHSLHARQAHQSRRHWTGGVARHVHVQVVDLVLGDGVQAVEGEEEDSLNAGLTGAVGKDEGRVDLVQSTARDDDGDFLVLIFGLL